MGSSGTSRQVVLLALAWSIIALAVLLAPSPREWGAFGHWISPYYDRINSVFEPAVHVVLMGSMATVCMYHYRRRNAVAALVYSFVWVMVVAALLEGLQSLLPREFARRCDVEDLIPGAVGAALGCFLGLCARLLKPAKNKRRKKD